MAAAYDIPIIPHGSSVYSYHLQVMKPPIGHRSCTGPVACPALCALFAGKAACLYRAHTCNIFFHCAHLQYAYHNCPIAEFINLSPKADKISPYFGGCAPQQAALTYRLPR